jgi:hypothetical protein
MPPSVTVAALLKAVVCAAMLLYCSVASSLGQRVPVRQYVRDVIRTFNTQYAPLAGPVRSGSTLLLLLLLLLLLPAKLLQVLLTFQPCTLFKSVLTTLIYMFDV